MNTLLEEIREYHTEREIAAMNALQLLCVISDVMQQMKQDSQPTKDVPVNDSIHQLAILGLRQGEYIDYLLDCINCSTSIKVDTQTEFEARNGN
jgi:hypothetical protein